MRAAICALAAAWCYLVLVVLPPPTTVGVWLIRVAVMLVLVFFAACAVGYTLTKGGRDVDG